MIDYSDMSLGQIYDLLSQEINESLRGRNNLSTLKLLKKEADRRDKELYNKVFQEVVSKSQNIAKIQKRKSEVPPHIASIQASVKTLGMDIAEVIGDSMLNRGVEEGNYVLFDMQSPAKIGDIILIEYRGQMFIKNYFNENGNIVLRSSNREYPDIVIDSEEEYRLLGVVKMILSKI